ncbi:MAG: hypothetical protein EKK59_10385 [Neisseriaceae bacterium]|nr:MAG: hypothetical protein EKK59_10385 [Neisseriaceae bacterium]
MTSPRRTPKTPSLGETSQTLTAEQIDALQSAFERAANDWLKHRDHPQFVSDQGGDTAAAEYRSRVDARFRLAANALKALGCNVEWIDENETGA